MYVGPINRPLELSLRLIGAWPYSSSSIPQRLIWSISMLLAQICQYWYLYAHIAYDSMPDLMDCLSILLSNTLLFVKLVVLWLNTRLFYDILAAMTEDWSHHSSTEWTARAMTRKAVISDRFSKCIVGMYSTASTFYMLPTLLQFFIPPGASDLNETWTSNRKLHLKMEFPFDVTRSPTFELTQITQMIFEWFAALMAGMMLAIVAALILHVTGQIDIVCGKLLRLRDDSSSKKSCIVTLRDIIKRHQKIISMADDIDAIFTYMSFTQFLTDTITICSLGFVLVTSLGTEEGPSLIIKSFPYYGMVNFEAFVMCFAGEYLSLKSRMIAATAYDVQWYDLNPAESRILLLLMLRSQRELTLTVGKFMHLSLESFASVLKISASYISVLYALYEA